MKVISKGQRWHSIRLDGGSMSEDREAEKHTFRHYTWVFGIWLLFWHLLPFASVLCKSTHLKQIRSSLSTRISQRSHGAQGSTRPMTGPQWGFSKWAAGIFLRKAYVHFPYERVRNRKIPLQKIALKPVCFPLTFLFFSISSMFSDLENKLDKKKKKKKKKKLGNKVFLGVLRILSFSEQTF